MKLITNIFDWLEHIFNPEPFMGVLADNRSEEQKQLDPLHEEVAGSAIPIITWTQKDPSTWKHYTLRNQNLESSDCVAFSTTTGIEADRGLAYPLSPHDIYDRRSNYPNPGMIPFEGLSLVTDYGILPDSVAPSDNLTETQLNVHLQRSQADLELAAKLAGGIPTKITNINIDTIASVIAQGKSVRLCFHFTQTEWTAIPQLYNNGSIAHQVIGIDYSIVNGKKCIIIQDSCFLNTSYAFPHGLRAITEEFLLERCFFAGYIQPIASVVSNPAPQHIFTVDMQYGDQGTEVMQLQTKLLALGFFSVAPTGFYGGLTKRSVMAYQSANGLPVTGFVGPLTRAALNK